MRYALLILGALAGCAVAAPTNATGTGAGTMAPSPSTSAGTSNGNGSDNSELALILSRRRSDLAEFPPPEAFGNVSLWIDSQTADGTWADVNYKSGCEAQRANWPIQQHWVRIITLLSAWSGLNPSAPSPSNKDAAFAAAVKAMTWWFANDFTSPDCIAQGGKAGTGCPCGTPGLWNTNWFGQVLLIPQLAGTACLLARPGQLPQEVIDGCVRVVNRPWALRDQSIPGIGKMTGANAVNLAQNSVSLALFTNDQAMLTEALTRAFDAVTLTQQPTVDGIHPDGSFLQHDGILYNGNYGKDLINAFIQLEGEAIGTSFAANQTVREAFATMIRGSEWMIFPDQESPVRQLHWDFNVIGRFVAFKTDDLQASADIMFNTSKLAKATADFSGTAALADSVSRLQSNGTKKLEGNKGFWASDYMVHRRKDFVLANKMISTRSKNTEFTNSANPLGYHLGQGTLFAYSSGAEYKDIMASWDWNLVPGTTVILNHPTLKLDGSVVNAVGNKTFVGVVSDGQLGLSAMDYVDPKDRSLAFRKTWAFFDDSVVVTTSNVVVASSGNSTAPVVTVLDNRRAADSDALVDGQVATGTASGKTLLYDNKGYLAHTGAFDLTLARGPRTGNWSAISTSTAGVDTVDVFSAYTKVPASGAFSYELFPSADGKKLEKEAKHPQTTVVSAEGVHGAMNGDNAALAFFQPGTITFGEYTVSSTQPALYLVNFKTPHKLTISAADPTQVLASSSLTIKRCPGKNGKCKEGSAAIAFPKDIGVAGSSVQTSLELK